MVEPAGLGSRVRFWALGSKGFGFKGVGFRVRLRGCTGLGSSGRFGVLRV